MFNLLLSLLFLCSFSFSFLDTYIGGAPVTTILMLCSGCFWINDMNYKNWQCTAVAECDKKKNNESKWIVPYHCGPYDLHYENIHHRWLATASSVTLGVGMSVCQSYTLAQTETSPQPLDGLPCNIGQTLVAPRMMHHGDISCAATNSYLWNLQR